MGPLHDDNMTVSTEEVRVDEYLVFDYNEHGTGRVSDYNVFETTMGSVFDIAALKKRISRILEH